MEELGEHNCVRVFGAREHNLKNIDVIIPRDKLVVITGVSGSGKSSLAFDTIFAEGQRRYMESFSAYVRQFIGKIERPDVEEISGLSPVISIEQKTVSKNPRSTVGTITEVYDFMRVLFARAGEAYSYNTGKKMVQFTEQQIIDNLISIFGDEKIILLAPVVKSRKGHYRELFEQTRKKGYLKAKIDGEIIEIEPGMELDRYKIHDIDIVIDRLVITKNPTRLSESLKIALQMGNGSIVVQEYEGDLIRKYSSRLMCADTGLSYDEPAPNSFSFNSPYGACSNCDGIGAVNEIDLNLIIPNKSKAINEGGILPLGEYKDNITFKQVKAIAGKFDFNLSTPIQDIPEEALDILLYGTGDDAISVQMQIGDGKSMPYQLKFEGMVDLLNRHHKTSKSESVKRWAEEFMNIQDCPECEGARLKKNVLYFKIADKNIAELCKMNIRSLKEWFGGMEDQLSDNQRLIAHDLLKEINARLGFLDEIGLSYLTLNRTAKTLSGGESQRIRLATQIGSRLTGVLYILDEPTIGLHQRDNDRLIESLKHLVGIGNSVIVVEHDKDLMLAADYIIDIGPGAGKLGGYVVGESFKDEFIKGDSTTAKFLNTQLKIELPKERRKGNGYFLSLFGATGNNLKNVDVHFPLGKMNVITGVSGSGKSSLINNTLYPILSKYFYRSKKKPLPYDRIEGIEFVDKVIEINQSPIGRTPRSNPATYIGVFSDIRALYVKVPESKVRGYKPGRFSFNVTGGRCETCEGGGMKVIEMNFLPDVYISCETCHGKRYNRETLEIRYKSKSISDVLDMTVEEAVAFFEAVPNIYRKVKTLQQVGLGYITLGQASTTLSGGEAQRVKLATELAKKDTGQTLYILDEPTTGLHFNDVKVLMNALDQIVDKGNTVIIIEHNMDVIKLADHIIDIGPEGGDGGGMLVVEGIPEEVAKNQKSFTSKYLERELAFTKSSV